MPPPDDRPLLVWVALGIVGVGVFFAAVYVAVFVTMYGP